VSTLVVSDLHLGSISHSDLARNAELRAPLLDAAADAERVVLLGDVLELRQGPLREAMKVARPFFEDLGRALAGRELVIVAGNHDHQLVSRWLVERGELEEPPPLELEQIFDPQVASPALARIAEWASPTRVRVAYPGLWLRPDVYATHGHYLDAHLTVPTLERLTVGAMSRLLGRPPHELGSVADYESLCAPLFAWRDAVARDARTGLALNGLATVNAWQALRSRGDNDGDGPAQNGGDGGSVHGVRRALSHWRERSMLAQKLKRGALVGAFPLAVSALNRAGLGPVKPNISMGELRRAGVDAMGEVAARLGLGDVHVVFGHTHRAGPLLGDDAQDWVGRGGARLINTGSWTYSSIFLTDRPGESPYWPGGCVVVEETGPPEYRCLLTDRSLAELASAAENYESWVAG